MIEKMVSVIITTYRATGRLVQAIESVLNQTYTKFELIVVDDNNPNSEARSFTQKIMDKYLSNGLVKYIKHTSNKNGAAARNTGINASQGEFIAFLDDDDVYYPLRLDKCVEALKNPDYSAVYTSVDLFSNDIKIGTREALVEGYIWKDLLLDEGLLGTGSNLFLRSDIVRDICGFDERFLRYQDVEFMLRVSERRKVAIIPEVLVRKNLETTNLPAYKKYYENKQLIFSKFSYMIEKLNDEEKTIFFTIHYDTLFNSAMDSCQKEYINDAVKNLETVIGKLPIKYYIKAKFPRLYRQYIRIKANTKSTEK